MPLTISVQRRTLLNASIVVGVLIFMTVGMMTELRLAEGMPLPSGMFFDFKVYSRALNDARNGVDPYGVQNIGLGYLYPPPSLLFLEPFTISPYHAQIGFFIAVNILLVAGMVVLLIHHFGYRLDQLWWWLPIALIFSPFLEVLQVGQVNVLTMFMLCLVFIWQEKRPFCAGIALGIAILIKLSPFLLVGYFLVTRDGRALLGTVASVIVFGFITGARYGFNLFISYSEMVQWLLAQFPESQSLVSRLVWHGWLSPDWMQVAQQALTLYMLGVLLVSGLLTVITRSKTPTFITFCLVMVIYPNVMWYHHFAVVLLPMLLWMGWARLRIPAVVWCIFVLMIIQLDRFQLTQGLIAHGVLHASILVLLGYQIVQVARIGLVKRQRIIFQNVKAIPQAG